jgi:hypothetical protein
MLLLVAIVCFASALPRALAQEAPDKIQFLHLRLTNGVVTLVGSTIVSGKFKPQADQPRNTIKLALESAKGIPLWEGTLPDPAIRRYEYTEPTAPGVIQRKVVVLENTDFTVRVPLNREAVKLSIYRIEPGVATNGNVDALVAVRATIPKLISTIPLATEGAK